MFSVHPYPQRAPAVPDGGPSPQRSASRQPASVALIEVLRYASAENSADEGLPGHAGHAMSLPSLSWTSEQETPRGGCELLSRSEIATRAEQLAAQGYVVARVSTPGRREEHARPGQRPAELPEGDPAGAGAAASDGASGATGPLRRGRLRALLTGAIDLALARRGAEPPDTDGASARGGDDGRRTLAQSQLIRAREVGAQGLCIVLPELRLLTDDQDRLDPEDSRELALWAELSTVWPLVVLVDRDDAETEALVPRAVGELVSAHGRASPRSALGGVPRARPSSHPARERSSERAQPSRATFEHRGPPRRIEADSRLESPMGRAGRASGGRDEGSGSRLSPSEIREHTDELLRARGPQPVRAIEQLFRTRYTPLLAALSSGQRHDPARAAVDGWRQDFERTYTDGYTALRVTGRRPAMVLDAPDIATRLARLNGARSIELLMVDAMRYDLGERVEQRLGSLIADRAVCVERSVLWSALPTVTPTQLRLLETGPRGLREKEPPSEREPTIHRGGSLTTLRRLRIGRRTVLKLDLAEARLRELGPDFETRMASIADEVAMVLARFARSAAPRTLLFVFGDHGFRLVPTDEPSPGGQRTTLPAQQGGASPEEVLVPATAWLVGAVH